MRLWSKKQWRHVRDTCELTLPDLTIAADVPGLLAYARGHLDTCKLAKVRCIFREFTEFDPLAISILLVFARTLSAERETIIVLPDRADVAEVLAQFGALKQLGDLGTSIEWASATVGSLHRPVLDDVEAIQPIKLWDDAASVIDYLQRLRDPDHRGTFLGAVDNSDLVASGDLRDVILAELSDNTVRHADAAFGHLMIARFRPDRWKSLPSSDKKPLLGRLSRFGERFAGRDCLAVVVGDAGAGIPTKLFRAFVEERRHGRRARTTIDDDVLEYAFDYHTTSRTLEERLGDIRGVLTGSSDDFPPPTGLFRLREIARKHAGLIITTSGYASVAIDCTAPDAVLRVAKVVRSAKSSAPLRGTQIAIYLPLEAPTPRLKEAAAPRFAPIVGTTYIGDGQRSHDTVPLDLSSEAALLLGVFDDVAHAQPAALAKNEPIVVDLYTFGVISGKALHYLIFELAQRQAVGTPIILLHVSATALREAKASLRRHPSDLLPIVAIDDDGDEHLLIASERADAVFQHLKSDGGALGEDMARAAQSMPHVFSFDAKTGEWMVRFRATAILPGVLDVLAAELRELTSASFRSDVRALLPSGVYSEGFYEVGPMFEDLRFVTAFERWLQVLLLHHRPHVIVSVGGACAAVTERALARTRVAAEHVPLTFARELTAQTAAVNMFANAALHAFIRRWFVVTDVIASGRTIDRIVSAVHHPDEVTVIALVDARDDGRETTSVAALRRPLHRWTELPRDWFPSDIRVVDPYTHRLIPPPNISQPLWTSRRPALEGNPFLEELVIGRDAFHLGHFVIGQRHAAFVFDAHRLARAASFEFAEHIAAAVGEYLERAKDATVTAVLVPENSRALATARDLSELLNAPLSIVSDAELRTPFEGSVAPAAGGNVVVCDAVLDSGGTFAQLIDIASRRGARRIFATALVARTSMAHLQRLQKIRTYERSELTLRFVGHVDVPSYHAAECPLCFHRKSWDRVVEYCPEDSRARRIARRERAVYDPIDVRTWWRVLAHLPPIEQTAAARNATLLKLEVGVVATVRNPQQRERLRTILKESSSVDALLLVGLLAQERFRSSLPAELQRLIFAPDISTAIPKVLKFWTSNASTLSDDELRSLLIAVDEFQPSRYLDVLPALIAAVAADTDKLDMVLMQCIKSEYCRANPAAVLGIIEGIVLDGPAAELLNDVSFILSGIQNELRSRDTKRVVSIRALTTQLFHDLTNRLKWLVGNFETEDAISLRLATAAVEQRIADITDNVRNALGPAESKLVREALTAATRRMTFAAEEVARVADQVTTAVRNRREDLLLLESSVDALQVAIASLRQQLAAFCVDVKRVADSCLNACIAELAAEIQVTVHAPGDACYVYCEQVGLRSVLMNLLRNAAAAARSQLILDVSRDLDAGRVIITISDDGPGLQPDFVEGDGLRDVVSYATKYCGTARVFSPDRDSRLWRSGRHTIASVTFYEIVTPGAKDAVDRRG